MDFIGLTMIDPVTWWFEIIELPVIEDTHKRRGKEIVEASLYKLSAYMAALFNKSWLSCYS